MRKNTFDIPQEEMDRFHKAMDAERTEQDARLEKLIEGEYSFKRRTHQNDSVKGCARIFTENRTSV